MTGHFPACMVLVLLVANSGCGDLIGYPIRHGPTEESGSTPGSVPAPSEPPGFDSSLHAMADAGIEHDPNSGSAPTCRWPTGADLNHFCSGPSPKAATDFELLPLQAVRLVGSVPRFHFVLLDGPTQLLVEWIGADAKADAKAPTTGRHDLATRAAQWGSRVFPATCDLDLNCSPPKDWLCEASGDHFVGWVDLHDGSSASLCLAVIRGSGHPSHELPCTTLLYTPGIPMM